ncbi:extracellular solute-binding protein [Bacillaceae bacterium SIJ1]|uniref:extracellular solute-binding protein n=1 Tax=Litoribacterium kuwaitense TaxID=1398745 RepID=UPI0013ECABF3|nr:extracellular solute-binding protein [Litoribacterium kuwaitense]NGP46185.1 extracellular solute-binding protein [Litoribacterium kuwaitense]
MNRKSSFWMLMTVIVIAITGCSNADETGGDTLATFNETGYPIVEEPITLEMMGKRSPIQPEWGEMGFFQDMEALTNIQFDYRTATNEDFVQNKQLAFASLELPDLFYGADLTAGEEVDYGSQGLLIPLEDLIAQYAPHIQQLLDENPELEASITTPDGHIYALPALDQAPTSKTPIMWMNGPWLQAMGAEKPATMEAFYELLKRIKEEDPGNVGEVIPLTANTPADLRVGLLPNFGIVQNEGIYTDGDVVEYAWVQDEFKAYLTYMNRLYEEELLDNEMFSHTWEQFVAKGDRTGIFSTWPIVQVGFEDPADALNYPILPPMTSEVNDIKQTIEYSEVFRGRAAITKDNPHPEATIRWLDYLYSEEGTILSRLGIEGETYEWNEDDQWILLSQDGLSTTETNAQHAPGVGTSVPMVLTEAFYSKEGGNSAILEIYEWVNEELIPYAKMPYPQVYFTVEEQQRISMLKTDIDSYFEQMEAKFITGAQPIDETWDEYVETLQQLGIDELVELNQAAYDRWLETQ